MGASESNEDLLDTGSFIDEVGSVTVYDSTEFKDNECLYFKEKNGDLLRPEE